MLRHLRIGAIGVPVFGRIIGVLAATIAMLASYAVYTHQGTYIGQVDVIFTAPAVERTNDLNTTSQSLISTAGVVAMRVNGLHPLNQPVSDSISLADQGTLNGTLVRLPNAGGQWQYNFDRPTLDVQATGQTYPAVDRRLTEILAQIRTALADIQESAGVDQSHMIQTRLSPSAPIIMYRSGSKLRAVLAIIFLLGVLTATVIELFKRSRIRRA